MAHTMVPLVFVLVASLTGIAQAKYNITDHGVTTRTFKCPLPAGCPLYTERYLTNYRYLNPNATKECTVADIEAALIKFQEFMVGYNVSVSGTCDERTIELFNKPRCGCEDMVKEDEMKKKRMMMVGNFYGPQPYQVGGTKWSKTNLKWKVSLYPRNNRHLSHDQVNGAMRRALDIWAQQTPLTFQQVAPNSPADIDIRFDTGRHTDSPPYYDFDGRGNVLAHAFFPESGVVHFDDDERFNLGKDDGTELYIVAAHEFGHTLGISHSNINEALMAPFYRYQQTLKLHYDDIQAIQYLYGAGTRPEVKTTRAPPRPVPTTPKPNMPDYCNMRIQAAFKIGRTTYIFTNDPADNYKTIVYRADYRGLNADTRTPIGSLFTKRGSTRWPRAHPYRVDAAAYVPSTRKVFLLSGTRAYRYTQESSGRFVLDKADNYPKWMDVEEFPERPRAAVPMPMGRGRYYMLIFGRTMVWDWDFEKQRVGAWAYPISSFGRNMPTNVHTAFLESTENVVFIKGDQYIRFNLPYRRVMDQTDSVTSVKRDFFKQRCA